MSDSNNSDDKTLNLAPKKTLTLKRTVEQGTVRQSFSHGRTKAVVVEKKKSRDLPHAAVPHPHAPAPQAAAPAAARIDMATPAATPAAVVPARPAAVAAPATQVAPPAPQPATPAQPVAPRPAAVAPAAPAAARPQQPPARPQQGQASASSRPGSYGQQSSGSQQSRTGSGYGNSSQGQRPGQGSQSSSHQQQQRRPGGVVLRTLSQDEIGARAQALAEARIREAEEARRRIEDEARRKVEEEARAIAAAEEAVRQAAEDARRKIEEEAAAKAAAEAAANAPPETRATARPAAPKAPGTPGKTLEAPALARKPGAVADDEDDDGKARPGAVKKKAATPVVAPKRTTPADDRRVKGRLTVTTALTEDEGTERGRSMAALRRRREKEKRGQQTGPREKVLREVILPEQISIQELANRMAERSVDVIRLLMKQGTMLKINDVIDADTAELIAVEMGHTVKRVSDADVEDGLFAAHSQSGGDLVQRPPVVTIMGHVDHGKTSLLDALRHANVVAGEAGGITQHIGAYQVEIHGQKITFIDTPGHAAFTAMRARGAKATDIVILVVAADDGVMPQTIEAIAHAKAAGVPVIVAINKVDKPDAKPERVRTELLRYELQVESMGGDVLEVEVSAKMRTNLDKLLEAILLQAEVLDLKAVSDCPAEGIVIEAKLDKGRGPVATVLVQRGTLKVGDVVVAGEESGRVRALLDDKGNHVPFALPSMPVEVLGFQGTPSAGDRVAVVENEARAREIAEYRERLRRENTYKRIAGARSSLEQMMTQLQSAGRKEFALVVKTDVQGSLEAISASLEKLGNDEVIARIIHGGVGGVTESDISLAEASDAVIIGFNVRANPQAREFADREGIEIRYYNIIYNLVDDVKAAMSGLLTPERRETFLGNAEILEVFNISKVGKVAGCRVTEGAVERGASVRLIRDNVVIHEGKLGTLKRFKDDVKDVQVGQECGMNFENYQDMRAGDIIECFRVEQIARYL